MYLVRLRKRKAAERRASGRVPRKPRPPVKDLGVPDSVLLARYEAGETYRAIGQGFGVGRGLIKDRVDRARAERAAVLDQGPFPGGP
ncbi:hypothetical protein ABZ234_10275 [Nocardiopsis sp. NPDC006198]|uniref:hypothetical protein n=1 Tax=Nocardiopsis sp. NPDC006198 TaxID=3154472 RepID=UPI00339DDAA6